MLERMEELIRQYEMLDKTSRVVCAVSGGADSICMLHGLYRLREKVGFELVAAHYNHNLRGEQSERDAAFVSQFLQLCCGVQRCADGRILPPVVLYTGSGDVAGQAKARGTGLEETAREMRYAFLRSIAKQVQATCIATAHTADDNVETVLFHLARGSGLQGVCGIQAARGDLIRPMLTTTRQEVESYLAYWGLPHVEDHTNRDVTYARNRIRHQVTPVLEQLYPGFSQRMANTALRLRQDEQCLSDLARERLDEAVIGDGEAVIPARAIAQAPRPIAVRMVRQLMAAVTLGDDNCSASHLDSVVDLCQKEEPSGQVDLPHGLVARREYERLCLTLRKAQKSIETQTIDREGDYSTGEWTLHCRSVTYEGEKGGPYEFYISPVHPFMVRARRTGDELRLPNRCRKSVKKWLVEEKVPRHLRDTLPVLEMDDRVAAVTGLGADEACQPQQGELAWHIVLKPEQGEE